MMPFLYIYRAQAPSLESCPPPPAPAILRAHRRLALTSLLASTCSFAAIFRRAAQALSTRACSTASRHIWATSASGVMPHCQGHGSLGRRRPRRRRPCRSRRLPRRRRPCRSRRHPAFEAPSYSSIQHPVFAFESFECI